MGSKRYLTRRRAIVGAGTAFVGFLAATGRFDQDGIKEEINEARGEGDPLVDNGGIINSRIERVEWSTDGMMTVYFEPGHGTDYWALNHRTLSGDVEKTIKMGESPTFEGPVTVNLSQALAAYEEQLPSRELTIDLWTETVYEDAVAKIEFTPVEHTASFDTTIPEQVDIDLSK